MSLDIDVLRTLLRLSRRRCEPTFDALVERTFADEASIRRTLFSLAQSGLIQRTRAGLRLTLPGLALAVACAKVPRTLPRARTLGRPATPAMKRSSRRRAA